MPSASSFFLWVSVIIGSGIGILYGAVTGPGKLLSVKPYDGIHGIMVHGFENVYGPFLGVDGRILRKSSGIGEIVAGLGLVLGLWIDLLAFTPEALGDLMRTLVIAAAMALLVWSGVGAIMLHHLSEWSEDRCDKESAQKVQLVGHDWKYDQSVPPQVIPLLYAIQLTILVVIRIIGYGPRLLGFQVLLTLLMAAYLGMAGGLIYHNKDNGLHRKELLREARELDVMQQRVGGWLV